MFINGQKVTLNQLKETILEKISEEINTKLAEINKDIYKGQRKASALYVEDLCT